MHKPQPSKFYSKRFLSYFMPFPTTALGFASIQGPQQISPACLCFLLYWIFLPCPSFRLKSSLRKMEYFALGQSCSSCLHKQIPLQIPVVGNLSHYRHCYFMSPRCITCWWLFSPATVRRFPLLRTYWGREEHVMHLLFL